MVLVAGGQNCRHCKKDDRGVNVVFSTIFFSLLPFVAYYATTTHDNETIDPHKIMTNSNCMNFIEELI